MVGQVRQGYERLGQVRPGYAKFDLVRTVMSG